jgi:hypothetical protein
VRVLEAADEVARELRGAAEVDFLHARLAGPDFGPRAKGGIGAQGGAFHRVALLHLHWSG